VATGTGDNNVEYCTVLINIKCL